MKTYLLLFLGFICHYTSIAIEANVSYASFKNGEQPYIEIYTYIEGASVQFTAIDSIQKQASVQVILLFKQDGQIVIADKFNLVSPTGESITDFVDLKRYAIANGKYELEVTIKDNYSMEDATTFKNEIKVSILNEVIQQSDIQLVGSASPLKEAGHPFAKQRYLLEPFPQHQYNEFAEQLLFYNEIYAPNYQGKLNIRYYLQSMAERSVDLLITHKERTAKALMPLLLSLDIKTLPKGNYQLFIEVRDSNKVLLSQKRVAFKRVVTPIIANGEISFAALDSAQLRYNLRALSPIIATQNAKDLNQVLKNDDLDAKRTFLADFWQNRHPEYTKVYHEKYMQVVKAVDNTFKSGFRYGFETDRGHRYLQYGQPDDIINVQDDPVAPPYEIWVYYDFPMTNQTNVRFLFYNPSLAGGDYVLLHSTVIGEVQDPQWELVLYKDAPNEQDGNDFVSGTKMKRNFGRRARQYMEDY